MDDLPQFKRTLLARYVERFGEAPDSGAFANALAERVKERVTDFMVENLCHLSTLELCELTRSFYSDAYGGGPMIMPDAEEKLAAPPETATRVVMTAPVKRTRNRRK